MQWYKDWVLIVFFFSFLWRIEGTFCMIFKRGNPKWIKRKQGTFLLKIGLVRTKTSEVLECWFTWTKIYFFFGNIHSQKEYFFPFSTPFYWQIVAGFLFIPSWLFRTLMSTLLQLAYLPFLNNCVFQRSGYAVSILIFQNFFVDMIVLLATLRNFNWSFPAQRVHERSRVSVMKTWISPWSRIFTIFSKIF